VRGDNFDRGRDVAGSWQTFRHRRGSLACARVHSKTLRLAHGFHSCQIFGGAKRGQARRLCYSSSRNPEKWHRLCLDFVLQQRADKAWNLSPCGSVRPITCEPSKTDCCCRLFESRLTQIIVTILAAVFMRQIRRIDSTIFSSPTFFGMSVVSAPSHDIGICPCCITWFTTL